ncbi:hypothetical protein DFH06DRAFT_328312 [Mycena polygramma]|nr:hypothetical protein DFH06DRAFT_328312 [Mycena polygramma]
MSSVAALDSPSTPSIPTELTEAIIFNVEDKATLRVCTLVCRAWVPPTRDQLHGRIFLSSHGIPRFFDLLSSPHNTYVHVVRSLHILGAENADVLLARLPEFSRLETISIHGVDFPYQFPALPAVTSLTLYSMFPSFHAFTQLLARFPGLRTLTLGMIKWHNAPAVNTTALPAPLRLDHLALVANWLSDDPVRDWLVSKSGGLVTRSLTLRLDDLDAQGASATSQYINRLGAQLEHLHLELGQRSAVLPFLAKEVDLRPSTGLRSLHISRGIAFRHYLDPPSVLPTGDSPSNYPGWDLHTSPRLIPLLGHVISESLETLILDITLGESGFSPREQSNLATFIGIFERSGPCASITKLEFHSAWQARRQHRAAFDSMVVQQLPLPIARAATLVDNKQKY